jgi:hypothetical protein
MLLQTYFDLTVPDALAKPATVDLFARNAQTGEPAAGRFVGRPFALDYGRAFLLVADTWKRQARGLPQGAFLLAFYEQEEDISEALLLRVLRPSKLPTENSAVGSMIEFYRDDTSGHGRSSDLDDFSQSEVSFSGVECRVLGTFYRDRNGRTSFGADVENYYAAHHYRVVKPSADALEFIVNFREVAAARGPEMRIGKVRFSSSRQFQTHEAHVPVTVNPKDFLGNRTALFGMTRTGKSNTIKKII